MGVFAAVFGRRGVVGFSGALLGVCSGVVGFKVAVFLTPVRDIFRPARPCVGASAKKFAPQAQNGRKTMFSGVLGEFFRGRAAEWGVLGEFFRGTATERPHGARVVPSQYVRAWRKSRGASGVLPNAPRPRRCETLLLRGAQNQRPTRRAWDSRRRPADRNAGPRCR